MGFGCIFSCIICIRRSSNNNNNKKIRYNFRTKSTNNRKQNARVLLMIDNSTKTKIIIIDKLVIGLDKNEWMKKIKINKYHFRIDYYYNYYMSCMLNWPTIFIKWLILFMFVMHKQWPRWLINHFQWFETNEKKFITFIKLLLRMVFFFVLFAEWSHAYITHLLAHYSISFICFAILFSCSWAMIVCWHGFVLIGKTVFFLLANIWNVIIIIHHHPCTIDESHSMAHFNWSALLINNRNTTDAVKRLMASY